MIFHLLSKSNVVCQENMNRNDIINRLVENDSTVLSFPDRCEEWGSNKYHGNCTGWIHAFLIWKYKVKKFAEIFAGSGTGYDVCRDMGIPYIGADLNPNPVRSGIMPIDVISEDVPAAFCDADMIFMHPPYGQEIGIPYAGAMYPDPTGELSRCDLGQMPWEEFISSLNAVIMKYYASMMPGCPNVHSYGGCTAQWQVLLHAVRYSETWGIAADCR